ncbi:MAG: hypothetical protein ACKO1U_03000 [Bacteroidota bacterium]
MLLQIDWNYIQYSQEEFDRTVHAFPLHIRFLVALALTLLIVSLVFLGFILASRIRKTNREQKKKSLLEKYTPLFQELILGDAHLEASAEIRARFAKTDLEKPFRREVLSDSLIHMHGNFSGEIAIRIERLFRSLDFHLDLMKSLRRKEWYLIAKGMRNLALMNIREVSEDLQLFLSHKNQMVRYEARIAAMKLSEKDHLAFLDQEKTYLSDWDQANIYAMLTRIPDITIPEFSRWLDSKNPSVVNFAIYMIGRFNQLPALPSLIRMLDKADENQRILIFRTIKVCNFKDGEEALISRYSTETDAVKKEILDTLLSIASERSGPFLETLMHESDSKMDTLVKVSRCLLALGERGTKIIRELNAGKDERIKSAVLHASDPRI